MFVWDIFKVNPFWQGKSNDPAKEDAANLTPVSHVKSKVKKEKVKKVATKENPAASVESSEQAPTFGLDAEMLARIEAEVLDEFKLIFENEVDPKRDELAVADWLEACMGVLYNRLEEAHDDPATQPPMISSTLCQS